MKNYLFAVILGLAMTQFVHGQYGINQPNPHTSSTLDISSTNKGILIPRMNLAERNAIMSPAEGLLIFQTNNSAGFYFYKSGAWVKFNIATGQIIDSDGDTEVTAEKNVNEDKIRCIINGNERYILENFGTANLFRINVNSILKNIFIGSLSGQLNVFGNNNVALGDSSLHRATSSFNIALGSKSLAFLTTGARNTAIGHRALYKNSTSNDNTAIGLDALSQLTTGTNTAIGLAAMKNIIIGNHNTAIGALSMEKATSGFQNTAIGYKSLQNNTIGSANTAIGHESLRDNTIGFYNTSIGSKSLSKNTLGNNNTAYGAQSLMNSVNGNRNTGYGFSTMRDLLTGNDNTALGWSALKNAGLGNGNTAVGSSALGSAANPNFNTAIGTRSLQNCNGCNDNLALGFESLNHNTSGSRNTALGFRSLFHNETGNDLTGIGSFTTVQDDGFQNSTAIGYQASINASNVLTLGSVAGENDATSSAYLEIGDNDMDGKAINRFISNSRGLLVPRMTNAQRNAIVNPATGLLVYSLTNHHFSFFNGQVWENMKDIVGRTNATNGQSFTYSVNDKSVVPGYANNIGLYNGPNAKVVQDENDASFLVSLTNNSFSIDRNNLRTKFRFAHPGNNIFFGKNCGASFFDGNSNICFGVNSLNTVLESSNVVAIGGNIMNGNTYANDAVAVGYNTCQTFESSDDIALGANALQSQSDNCIAIGRDALAVGSGDHAIGLGAYTRTSGFNQIAIGARAQVTDNGNNKIVLGAIAGVNSATQSTSVGIGTTAPNAIMHVKGTGEMMRLDDSTGTNMRIRFKNDESKYWDAKVAMTNLSASTHFKFQYNSSAVTTDILSVDGNGFGLLAGTLTQSSDKRLKKEITPIDQCLNKVLKLKGVQYTWKSDKEKRLHFGLIAQDVEKVIPELIYRHGEYRSVDYSGVTSLVSGAINELAKESIHRENLIQANQKMIAELEAMLTEMESHVK